MEDSKSIKFRAVIDSGEFDRSISNIQRKMKNLQRDMSQMQQASRFVSNDPVVGKFAKDFFQASQERSGQGLREDVNKQRQQIQNTRERVEAKKKELEVLKQEMQMKEQSGELDKKALEAMQKKIQLNQKLVDNLNRVGASQSRDLGSMINTAQSAGIDVGMGQQGMGALSADRIASLRGRAANVRSYRGMGFGRGSARALSMFGGPAAVAGGILGGVGAAGTAAAPIMDYFATRENRESISLGQAEASASQEAMRASQGSNFDNIFRQRAMLQGREAAGEEFENRRARDITRGVGGFLASTGGYAAAGAAAGSILPVVGTVAGGIAGGIYGAVSNFRQTGGLAMRAAIGTNEYQAQIRAEQEQKARQVEQALMNQDPATRASMQFMQSNRSLGRSFQQGFGEQNGLAMGGMLENMQRAGITGQTGLQIAQAQQSASGITMGPEDMGDVSTAFRLQQSGLTNASRAMGVARGLSATFGGGEGDTDDAMKRLFAEAVSIGVDDSSMVQELRQFTDASIRLAESTGMGIDEAASEVGKGMIGEFSAFGLRSSQNAREIQRGMSTAGGASLDYKLAFAQSEEGSGMLGGMTNTSDILQFTNMDINNISEDNPVVKSMMEKMGIEDIDEFKRVKTEFDVTGSLRRGETRGQLKGITDAIKGKSPEDAMKFLQGEGSTQFQEFLANAEAENPLFKTQFGTATQLMGRLSGSLNPGEANTEAGERIMNEMQRRGAASGEADFQRQEAAAGLQSQVTASLKNELGSSFEILSEGSNNFMKSTKEFADAVERLQGISGDSNVSQERRDEARQELQNLRDTIVEALREGMREGSGFDSSGNMNQPSTAPSTGN